MLTYATGVEGPVVGVLFFFNDFRHILEHLFQNSIKQALRQLFVAAAEGFTRSNLYCLR